MPSSSGSTDFSGLFKSSLKELHSEKFYDAMDKDSVDLLNYDEECNKIVVKEPKDRMITICKKYLRFLDKSKSWGDVNYGYDVSLLLNYWLYEKVIDIYGDNNSDYITFAFTALKVIGFYFDNKREYDPYYKKCMPDISKVNHEDWKDRKKLYDYYVNYDYLLDMAKSFDNDKCIYYKKIKELISLYDSFKVVCRTSNNKCPDVFYKFRDKNIETVLEKLPCYTRIEGISSSPSDAISSLQLTGHKVVHGKSANDIAVHTIDDSTVESHTLLDSGISGIGTKVTHSILGAAPVLLTSTMLYRYTPLGSWIHRFVGERTNSMNTIDSFTPYTQETSDMFSEDKANYISYQPI